MRVVHIWFPMGLGDNAILLSQGGELGEKVSLIWFFFPYFELREKFKCIEHTVQVKKNPHIFLFHGETALCKILKFQEETANFSEKFQGEITEFLRENMELYRQNLKISGRNTGISWRKYWISWRNLEKFSTISPSFSQKKRQLIMEKNKKSGFFFTCTVQGK